MAHKCGSLEKQQRRAWQSRVEGFRGDLPGPNWSAGRWRRDWEAQKLLWMGLRGGMLATPLRAARGLLLWHVATAPAAPFCRAPPSLLLSSPQPSPLPPLHTARPSRSFAPSGNSALRLPGCFSLAAPAPTSAFLVLGEWEAQLSLDTPCWRDSSQVSGSTKLAE